MLKKPLFCLLLILNQAATANINIPGLFTSQLQESPTKEDALTQAGLKDFQDEVIEDKPIELNDSQLHEAKIWDLTDSEENRYLQLMQSRSGLYYQGLHLTPLDILGLNARDDNERTHFSELAAKFEAQKVAQNIAWNNAFYQAYNKLFKDVPVIGKFDPGSYSPLSHHPIPLKPGNTLYFFIKKDDAIKTILLMLIDAIQRTSQTQLNLLFLEMDSLDIEKWSNKNQLPIELVNNKQITLSQGKKQQDLRKTL
jgi:integrating conjugative element protein (TIGR03759 family)